MALWGIELEHCLKWVNTDLSGGLTQLIKTPFIDESFEKFLYFRKNIKIFISLILLISKYSMPFCLMSDIIHPR